MLYNKNHRPARRIKQNGELGETFYIGSGVAQGCPLSPLLFLLIGEALTRTIMTDKQMIGITVGNTEHRLTQFADDTLIMLRKYETLKRMWEILKIYEETTGMKANRTKSEGFLEAES